MYSNVACNRNHIGFFEFNQKNWLRMEVSPSRIHVFCFSFQWWAWWMFDWIDLFLFSTNSLFGSFMFSMFIMLKIVWNICLRFWAYGPIILSFEYQEQEIQDKLTCWSRILMCCFFSRSCLVHGRTCSETMTQLIVEENSEATVSCST